MTPSHVFGRADEQIKRERRVNGVVECSAADGAGGRYIGGSFTSVGGVARTNLAHIRAALASAAAIDLVANLDGEGYIFLELNPNGQWAWLEAETGQPLTAALVDLLDSVE